MKLTSDDVIEPIPIHVEPVFYRAALRSLLNAATMLPPPPPDQDFECGCAVRRGGSAVYVCDGHMHQIEALPRVTACGSSVLSRLGDVQVFPAKYLRQDDARARGSVFATPSYAMAHVQAEAFNAKLADAIHELYAKSMAYVVCKALILKIVWCVQCGKRRHARPRKRCAKCKRRATE